MFTQMQFILSHVMWSSRTVKDSYITDEYNFQHKQKTQHRDRHQLPACTATVGTHAPICIPMPFPKLMYGTSESNIMHSCTSMLGKSSSIPFICLTWMLWLRSEWNTSFLHIASCFIQYSMRYAMRMFQKVVCYIVSMTALRCMFNSASGMQ